MQAAEQWSVSKVNVLLVDDEPANLLALCAILEGLGLNLVEARSGEEALRLLLEDDFAVVLLDVQMRDMDGLETARQIRGRERSQHTPIIFVTAFDSANALVNQAYSLGAVDYLVKPLVAEILRAKVAVFVDLFQKAERIRQLEREQFERKLIEEKRQREQTAHIVTTVMAEFTSESDAMSKVLQSVCEHLAWDVSALWTLDESQQALHCAGHWCVPSVLPSEFVAESRQRTFKAGVGLPGRVWESREPTWIPELEDDKNFPRFAVAEKEGLRSALAFPLATSEEFLGVMEFFSRKRREPDKEMLRTLAEIGRQLGLFIQRKRAEHALAESERRKRAMLEAALDCVITIDHEGKVVEWNPAAERTFGYRRSEVLGQVMAELIVPPLHRNAHQAGLARFISTGEGPVLGRRLEMPAIRADGSEFPAELAIVATPSNGKPLFTGYLRDITERKRAEETIRAQHENLRVTLSSIGDAVIATDNEARVTFLNSVAEALTGWSIAEAAGKNLEDIFVIVNEQTRRPAENPVGRVLQDGKVVGLANHTVLRSKDGMERPIDDSAAPIKDSTGKLSGVVLVFRDVTERRQTEEGLSRLAAIVDSSDDAIVSKTLDGIVISWNRAAEKMFGYTAAEAVGRHISLIIPEDRLAEEEFVLTRLRSGQKIDHFETERRAKDGQKVDISLSVSPIRDAAGQIIGASKVARNITDKKRAEQIIREQSEHLRVTLASIGDAVIATDRDGRVTFLNHVAETLIGWNEEEAVGQPIDAVFQIVNETSRQPAENPIRRVIEQGVIVGLANHTTLIAKDGVERPIADSAAPIKARDGSVTGVVLVFRDVTDGREAERRLEESEERHRAISELTSDYSYVARVDPDGEVTFESLSDGFTKITGFTLEDMKREGWALVIHPDDLPIAARNVERLLTGEAVTSELRVGTKSGETRWLRTLTQPFWDEPQRRVVRILGAAQDITERKNAELALGESESRFRTLAAYAPVGIFQTDSEGHCGFVNECWCEMAGLSREDAAGQAWARALHPEDRERVFREWYDAAKAGLPFASEYRFQTPQGTVTWLQGSATALHDDRGKVTGYIGTLTDVTERKRTEEALREADRRKDEFLAMLAHELRNPLAPIRNTLHILKLKGTDWKTVDQVREMMERQVGHMGRLVDDLLDVSRITRGKVSIKKERLDLSRLVRQAVDDHKNAFESAGIACTVDVSETPVWVTGDATRITQILDNLLTNAAKFTNRGGKANVSIAAREKDERASVTVRDTGIGIEPEMLPQIFDVFAQADRSLDRSTGGLGLGLALVKGLVELHGGTVEATSEGVGRGAEFTFWLHQELELPALSKQEVPPKSGNKRLRILVVEDNKDSADSLRMLLELFGYEVTVAYSGPEGVQAAQKTRPDVVLCDIGLPGMDGFAVVGALRRAPETARARVIAVTGYGQEEDRVKALAAGFDDHLVKPVAPQKLLDQLSAL